MGRFAITEDKRYQRHVKHKLSNMMTFANNKEAFLKRDLGYRRYHQSKTKDP